LVSNSSVAFLEMLKLAAFALFCAVLAVRDKDHAFNLNAKSLPCTLTVRHGTAKKKGGDEAKASFAIDLKCSEKVTDARLMVPWLFKDGSFPLNIKGSEDTDEIQADKSQVIWSSHTLKENEYFNVSYSHKEEKWLSYVGSTFSFTAKCGEDSNTEEVSIVIPEAPETTTTAPPQPITGGDLPCTLSVGDVTETQAAIKLSCTEDVKEVRLITPSPFNNIKFSQPLTAGKSWTLTTLERTLELAGKTFVVEAIPKSGSDISKSNLAKFPAADASAESEEVAVVEGGLPCKLTSSAAKLVGGGAGFTLSMKCDETVTDAKLKIPGYADRIFKDLTGGTEYNLATYPKQDEFHEKAFYVEAKWQDTVGKSNEVFQP